MLTWLIIAFFILAFLFFRWPGMLLYVLMTYFGLAAMIGCLYKIIDRILRIREKRSYRDAKGIEEKKQDEKDQQGGKI